MKKILLTFLFLLVAFPVYAYELLMFSNPKCSYCQEFLRDVKPTYHQSVVSKILPLKILSMDKAMPVWIAHALDEGRLQPIKNTPTFVIWDEDFGTEVARLVGYGGKKSFYEMVDVFVKKNKDQFKFNKKPEGSHGPMNEFGDARVPPEGVINSRDIFQHMYKTPKEALKASKWLGCHGNIHYHDKENVWMPCSMQ